MLDVLRVPRRADVRVNEQSACLSLLRAADDERLDVLVADLVRTEFADHVGHVHREAKSGLATLAADVAKVDQLAGLHGSHGKTDIEHWLGHADRCRRAAERWLSIARKAPQSDDITSRATDRVLESRTPSRRGKDSLKDCIIIETYLEDVRLARAAGLSASVVFVSSNVRDYATSPG